MADVDPGEYVKRTFSLSNLSFHQARMVKRIFIELNKNEVRLKSGRRINKPRMVFRWMLENITIEGAPLPDREAGSGRPGPN